LPPDSICHRKAAVIFKRYCLVSGVALAIALAGCAGAITSVTPGTTGAGDAAPMPTIVHRANSIVPTLYILNQYVNKTQGWVSAYSDAGATFARKFGTIGGDGPDQTSMAADASGHLYLYTGDTPGQVLAYKNYGAKVLQTLQFQKGVFSTLTLDHSGNLFAEVTAAKKFAGPLDEFGSNGAGTLKDKPFIRRDAVPFYIATDEMGDVASAGGINGLKVYKKKSNKPFWMLKASNTLYVQSAFDPSNNLYVVQEQEGSNTATIGVYARGASAPMYSISDGVYLPAQLAFDNAGNLYVLDYCPSSCGSNPTSVISIYAPDATNPSTVLQATPGSNFGEIGVSSSGYVAAVEYHTGSYNGPVVVYAPGTTVPATTISTGLQFPGQVVFGN
jgi:hypothetical protein